MSDLISRQQAIDALEQIFDRCEEIEAHLPEGDPDRTGYKMYPDYMTVWKYLHQLPSAQPEQRWIPCSERQPDKEGDYLVTLCDDGRTWVEVALWNETFGGRWQVVLYNDVDYSDISNVIAWMPLPEPWKGEEDEAD